MSDKKRKTGDEQPTPFKGEFSFVNKDARNIDSKDHNAAVSWHVMNRYERWKKQEQAKKLRASANVPLGPLSAPQPQQPTTSAHRVASPFAPDPWTMDEPAQSSGPVSDRSMRQRISGNVSGSSASTPSMPSTFIADDDLPTLNAATPDFTLPSAQPFDLPAVPFTPLVNNLVSFAYDFVVPQAWPNESGSVRGTYEIARSWEDIAAINLDACFANAYLAFLAATMAATTDDENLAFQSRAFQSQAMTELRSRVSQQQGGQDLSTLKAILKLFSTETLVDNTSVARVHLKMLRNLVTADGGVILIDSWFRENLLSCDCYFALKYETRPLFPANEWTPGPLSQPWKARLVTAGIFGDHAAGIDPLIEHPNLKAIVTDLRELFKAEEYISTHELPHDDQLLRWRQLRRFDCVSRVAHHHVDVTIYPHLFSRPRTQAYSCIAISVMTAMVLGSPEPVRFGLKLVKDLRRKMTEAEGETDEEDLAKGSDRRLRLWALYVGMMAERTLPVPAEEKWFEEEYERFLAEMALDLWDDIKKVLRHFLFSEKVNDEVESGRAYRMLEVRQGVYEVCGTSWREPTMQPSMIEPGGGAED